MSNREGGPFRRLFTVAEANATLARLGPLLRGLQQDRAAARGAQAQLDAMTPAMRQNGSGPRAAQLELEVRRLSRRIAAAVQEIMRLGVEIKDLDHGIVDFPCRRDDRIISLCWRLGEPEITHWHELDDGFAGRQPL